MADLLGYVGLALGCVMIAWLWMSRLGSVHSNQEISADQPAIAVEEPNKAPPHRYDRSITLTPVVEAPTAATTQASTEIPAPTDAPVAKDEELVLVSEAIERPDSESAREQLKIAAQLQVIGDFEGAIDYCQLVIEDPDASDRQKVQAENLMRLARSF